MVTLENFFNAASGLQMAGSGSFDFGSSVEPANFDFNSIIFCTLLSVLSFENGNDLANSPPTVAWVVSGRF